MAPTTPVTYLDTDIDIYMSEDHLNTCNSWSAIRTTCTYN